MSTVLLDTTVASLLHPKKTNDALRVQYETHMEGQILAVSFQTVAELGRGQKRTIGERRCVPVSKSFSKSFW